MAILRVNTTQSKLEVYRNGLADMCCRNPDGTILDLLASVSGLDPETNSILDILAYLGDHLEDTTADGEFPIDTKIKAMFTLPFGKMAGAVEANATIVAKLEKKIYDLLGDGDFWTRGKLVEAANPDFDKTDPQDVSDMSAAFDMLVKRKDIGKFDKENQPHSGKGRWSFLQRQ